MQDITTNQSTNNQEIQIMDTNQLTDTEITNNNQNGVGTMNCPLRNFRLLTISESKPQLTKKINAITFSKSGKVLLSAEITEQLKLTSSSNVQMELEVEKTSKKRKEDGVEKMRNITTTKKLGFRFDNQVSGDSNSKMELKTESKTKRLFVPAKQIIESEVELKNLLKGYRFDTSAVTVLKDANILIVDLLSKKGKESTSRKSNKSQQTTKLQQSA